MLEAEIERGVAAGAIASIKAHDSKRFRLRAVSHETEIYQRYFHKSIAEKVSWLQMGFSPFVLLAQMAVMFLLMGHFEFYDTCAHLGTGIWASCITAFAVTATLWACKKPSYGKLHLSMALHIISLLAQIIGTFILFCFALPEIRQSIKQLVHGDYRYYDNEYLPNGGVLYDPYSPHNDTPVALDPYNATQKSADEHAHRVRQHLLKTFDAVFVLNATMSLFGILQSLLSFFMSLKTGRAICCGRTHLEGKFLEMEAVGRENSDAVVNFRVGAKEKTHLKTIQRADSLGPPPSYTPELYGGNGNMQQTKADVNDECRTA